MSLSREDVIRYIEGLSSEELGDLVDEIQKRLGLPPLPEPAVFRTDGTALTGMPIESYGYAVKLLDPGPQKLLVIKLVRERLGLGLAEAKALVERPSVELMSEQDHIVATSFAEQLIALGAKAEIVRD